MKRKYYSLNGTKEIYYTGKDQKNQPNLINIRSGSEYFLPGYYLESSEKVSEFFTEIPKDTALSIVPDPYGNHSFYSEMAEQNKEEQERKETAEFERMKATRRQDSRRRNGL